MPDATLQPESVATSTGMGLPQRLLSAGLITETQLELATVEHRRKGGNLPQLLVDLGFVSAEKVAQFIAHQTGTKVVDLNQLPIDEEAVGLLPLDVARRLKVVPFARYNGCIVVAMADQTNVIAIDQIARITELHVDVVAATERDVLNTLDRIKASGPSIQESIERIIESDDTYQAKLDLELEALEEATADDAPIIQLVNQIITRAVMRRASDIHFEPAEKMMRIRTRVDGVLLQDVFIPKPMQSAVSTRLKILAEMDVTENRLPQDGRATVVVNRRKINLRVSSLPTQHGESVVLRILDTGSNVQRLSDLGLEADFEAILRNVIEAPHGVVIVTGPTGSGKTTTLYAILNEINQPDLSIFTIEDPVELPMAGIRQTQVKEEVGMTFSAALRSLLRQDPDIILVGETRDTETAQLMIRAALTGHLVFTTLHTNDAPGAIPRLLDMGVEPYLLPSSLVAVLGQRLVRRLCPSCKRPVADAEKVFADMKLTPPADLPCRLWEAVGCGDCNDTGYRGRQAIFEIMVLNEGFHRAIINRAANSELLALARAGGMRTMFEDGLRQAVRGKTTLAELLRVTRPE